MQLSHDAVIFVIDEVKKALST